MNFEISNEKSPSVTYRDFTRRGGFADGAAFLRCYYNGETHAHMEDGSVETGFQAIYTLDKCERLIKYGILEEIT